MKTKGTIVWYNGQIGYVEVEALVKGSMEKVQVEFNWTSLRAGGSKDMSPGRECELNLVKEYLNYYAADIFCEKTDHEKWENL